MILTKNEKRVLRLIAIGKDLSINDVAKECGVSPAGAFKILTKLAKEGVLKIKPVANIKVYQFDFENEKTMSVLELAFIPDELEGRMKSRAEDLKRLREVTSACILFGSYITTKKEPGDLDVLFVVEKQQYEKYKHLLGKVQDITPVKIQDVVQTRADLEQNLRKGDPIVTEALRNGVVLWGFSPLVEVIMNASR